MSLHRGFDASEPPRPQSAGHLAGTHEERRARRFSRLAAGTLACPDCDAPVALGGRRMTPAAPLECPFCGHLAPVRNFLSLELPTRPARVVVRVVARPRLAG